MSNNERVVLPTALRPVHYELEFTPDLLDTFTFAGKAVIEMDVVEATEKAVLNTLDIEVSSASFSVDKSDWSDIALDSCSYHEKNEEFSMPLGRTVSEGKLWLKLEFVGKHNDLMKGFYRTKHVPGGDESKTEYFACTQFEPTDARRAFPCIDEPSVKAEFSVTLVVDADVVALSNMPEESRTPRGDKVAVAFQRSVKMSTYLLCMVVGRFEFVEDTTRNGTLVRTYCVHGKKDRALFMQDYACQVLPFYEKFFGIPYPLPKLDQICIPDFSAGAMENWGLVTYRETVLVDETSSISTKMWAAIVVAHELAHQWFGNLVTFEWWDDLWLNEGFASYMEYLCVDALSPELKAWEACAQDIGGRALTLDALESSHAIQVPINHAHQVDEIFDAISYTKGCAVIQMLATFVGTENFRAGVSAYLKHFAYGNANTAALWRFLDEATGDDCNVPEVMRDWTLKKGYPLVTATVNGDGSVSLRQRRFLSTGAPTAAQDATVWHIPICYTYHDGSKREQGRFLLQEKEACLPDVNVSEDGAWLHLNTAATGVYRVQYDAALTERLTPQLSALSAIDRKALLDDAEQLARAGVHSMSVALSLAAHAAESESEYLPFSQCAEILATARELVEFDGNQTALEKLNELCRNVAAPHVSRLGWTRRDIDSADDRKLRRTAIGLACRAGGEVTQQALALFERLAHNQVSEEELPKDLRAVVCATAMRQSAGSQALEHLKLLFEKASDDAETQSMVLRCMCLSPEESVVEEALDYVFKSGKVRPGDAIMAPRAGAPANKAAREPIWRYTQRNWSKMTEMYPGGFLLTIVIKTASHFAERQKADEVRLFHADASNRVDGTQRTVDQTVEAILANSAFCEKSAADVVQWLLRL